MTDETTTKVAKPKGTTKGKAAAGKRTWGPRPVYKGIKTYMDAHELDGAMTVDELLAHLRETIVDGGSN